MKFLLILCSAFIAGAASADKQALDKSATQNAVPGMDKAVHIEREDVKTKKYIGETEKNLQKSDLKHTNPKSVVINHEEQYIHRDAVKK